jgi:hypothetical protein
MLYTWAEQSMVHYTRFIQPDRRKSKFGLRHGMLYAMTDGARILIFDDPCE